MKKRKNTFLNYWFNQVFFPLSMLTFISWPFSLQEILYGQHLAGWMGFTIVSLIWLVLSILSYRNWKQLNKWKQSNKY